MIFIHGAIKIINNEILTTEMGKMNSISPIREKRNCT